MITCRSLLWLPLFYLTAAQITLTGTKSDESVSSTGGDYPTGSSATYATVLSTATLTTSNGYNSSSVLSGSATAYNSSTNVTQSTSTSGSQTLLVGSSNAATTTHRTGANNASSTSSSIVPTNTQPCNGYPEFCGRKFSNITHVAAHNSPFIQPNNAARNQMLDVTTQLNDGIRMLQMQTHYLNGTMFLCHTSCTLLNAGPLEAYLTTVTQWLQQNPYEVIVILMGNQDFVLPENYTAAFSTAGLLNYAYVPPQMPMGLDDWPTLADMILTNKRAVVMLDYQANQTAIPWLLDEFSQMWETPFSPTKRSFPCTPQRPPNAAREVREDRMFMVNHNLNVKVAVAGISLDLPAYSLLNETNAVTGFGSVGSTAENCTQNWGRPPNFLLVDFYNIGAYNASSPHPSKFNGSVFEVAARANNVIYNRDSCCGRVQSSTASFAPILWGPGSVGAVVLVLWSFVAI